MAPTAYSTALLAVWAAALITRLPPGPLEAGACRIFTSAGMRAALGFLGGIAVLDMVFTVVLLGSGWIGHGRGLPPVVAVATGAGVCALAISRLRRARRPRRVIAVADGIPLLAGVRAALESPGWWNWWLLVGSAAVAAGTAAPFAVGLGLMAGILTWGAIVLLTIRAGRLLVARVGEHRWEVITAGLLLLAGVLQVARGVL